MATKVVDASAVAAIAFVEPAAEEISDLLQGASLAAPTLIRYELASVCLTKLRKHPDDAAAIRRRYASLESIKINMFQVDLTQCIEMGLGFGLSIYDASYLWLARSLRAELVTLDKQLARAAAA